jgi:hypothetical protein
MLSTAAHCDQSRVAVAIVCAPFFQNTRYKFSLQTDETDGHSTITVSQRYVHPSPEAVELTYERMTAMNLHRLPTNSPQWVVGMWLLLHKLFVLSVPGGRNRQT